jgi:hypothetical protein
MAAAMTIDLGINKPALDLVLNDVRLQKARLFSPQSPEELEAQRTFLGCYFLTTSYVFRITLEPQADSAPGSVMACGSLTP